MARAALRVLAGTYLGVSPEAVVFEKNEFGKPYLTQSRLRFNVSHAHELAVIGFALEREIGVDIEWMRPLPEARRIARDFFSPGELAALEKLPAEAVEQGFFNCWTRKEAYIKAVGLGLNQPLSDFEVSLAPGEPARLISVRDNPAEVEKWEVHELVPGPGYAGALMVAGSGAKLKYWKFPFSLPGALPSQQSV
jgi:4'-phosphopantetheinyl transferase